MIDSHCHLDFPCFAEDLVAILSQCQANNIHRIVIPGTRAASWPQLIGMSQSSPLLEFSLGLHPYFLEEYTECDLVLLDELITRHRKTVVAVGEIGLDNSLNTALALQEKVFVRQLLLAEKHQLPVIIHHRRSHNQLIRALKAHLPSKGGIIHAFSGSLYEAQTYLNMGFKLGVGGTITYSRAIKTRKVFSQLPLSSLVLETDAPDMPLHGKQGERNSPIYLPLILTALQQLRNESEEEVADACERNTKDIFGLD
ncbi:MAG: TatD DNase family protein [Paraglaciecola sp.]|jgi:TatD DNase family protein